MRWLLVLVWIYGGNVDSKSYIFSSEIECVESGANSSADFYRCDDLFPDGPIERIYVGKNRECPPYSWQETADIDGYCYPD